MITAIGNYIGRKSNQGSWTPQIPTLSGLTVSDVQINLTATYSGNDEDGYSWERSDDGGANYSVIGTTGNGVKTYQNTGLTPDADYKYRVRAFKGSKFSEYSNVVSASAFTWSEFMQYSYTDVINTHATWTTAQKALILGRLQEEYVINTFGYTGQNKRACDFFMFFEVKAGALSHSERTITKTGDTLRWNYGDGNIYSQNNLPAQTSTSEITVTSTDGFSGMTRLDVQNNGLIGNIPKLTYYAVNLTYIDITGYRATTGWGFYGDLTGWQFKNTATTIYLANNYFTGDFVDTYIPDSCTALAINGNYFTGTAPYIRDTHTNSYFTCDMNDNRFSLLTGTNYCTGMGRYRIYNNCLSTSQIDALIKRVADYFETHTATQNFILNITGTYNGTITGGEANADVVRLRSYFTGGAGDILTLTYNAETYILTPIDTPTLVVTTDDDYMTTYTKLFPMLAARGKVGVDYRNESWIGGHMTITEVNALIAAGWSIESHPSLSLGETEAQTRTRMDAAVTFFNNNSIPVFNHVAYQGGNSDANIRAVMPEFADTGRSVMNYNTLPSATNRGGMIYKDNDMYQLPAISCDPIDATVTAGIINLLDICKIKSAGMIIYMHTLTDADIVFIAQLVDYAISKGFTITTMDGLYAKLSA